MFAEENRMDIVTIDPTMVIGSETYPNGSLARVNVQDVANIYIKAFENLSATHSTKPVVPYDVCGGLREHHPVGSSLRAATENKNVGLKGVSHKNESFSHSIGQKRKQSTRHIKRECQSPQLTTGFAHPRGKRRITEHGLATQIGDSERSENSSSQSISMVYDHTPPSIAVPQMFFSHEDQQIKSTVEDDWVYGEKLRNRVVKEGDASSLLVTSSSSVPVASDDGSSQGDPARCANTVSETCETASYNTNYQGRASHGSLLPANVHGSFPSRNVSSCVVRCTCAPGSSIDYAHREK
ncbi:hypothetical protein Tco_0967518 [Tanacetum coccineum]